mgnify:CR=1 FL=1
MTKPHHTKFADTLSPGIQLCAAFDCIVLVPSGKRTKMLPCWENVGYTWYICEPARI